MKITYQPTLVPGIARAVTLNYTDDSIPANSIAMFNVSLATSTDVVTGKISATVQRIDGKGIAVQDASGSIEATAEDVNEAAAVKAAALALAPRSLPTPSINSISHVVGPATGGISVAIAGANLIGATGVKFGVVDAENFTVDSMTQITAMVPAGVVGAVNVTVTTPGGTNTLKDGFAYQ